MNSISSSLPTGAIAGLSLDTGSDLNSKIELFSGENEQRAEKIGSEFESVFVSLLLKEMRNTLDQGEGGLFGSEQSDTFGGMFDLFMGQHIASASSLGIDDAINNYLKNKPL